MALIKCSECGKQVSDKANVCPACGNPIGGGGSVGSSTFERRIEQYKSNGYKLKKRNGDTVEMIKPKLTGFLLIGMIIGFPLSIFGIFLVIGNYWIDSNPVAGLVTIVMGYGLIFGSTYSNVRQNKVLISLTKTGKIEETGNVLKK